MYTDYVANPILNVRIDEDLEALLIQAIKDEDLDNPSNATRVAIRFWLKNKDIVRNIPKEVLNSFRK